jgi:isocitrate dehydrogenase
VQQFQAENFLRWDSLGEFLALAVSIEDFARKTGNAKAAIVAQALDKANGRWLAENKAPARKVGGIDNRGSHFYLALYWAEALAAQTEDKALATAYAPLARELAAQEARIVAELNAVQGKPVDIGGYYHPDRARVSNAMRPSPILNEALAALQRRQ